MAREEVQAPTELDRLRQENVWIKSEISKLNRFMFGMPASSPMSMDKISQTERYIELASSAVDELLKLGMANAPLWNRNVQRVTENLNFVEYARTFRPCLGTRPQGFVPEATRASCVIPMSSLTLVKALLDADKYREMFTSMIGSCSTMEVFSNGIGGSRNGALQLMKTEIQLPSNTVLVRSMKFIRFTVKREGGPWVVVDLSVDNGLEGHLTRRCPSGCILEDMPNGITKVTWIEHTEYPNRLMHNKYVRLIRSGVAFGAQRWINALLRHCACFRAITSNNNNLFVSVRRSLKALAQRMTSRFCDAICLTDGQHWRLVSVAPGASKIMARNSIAVREPAGAVLCVTHSYWTVARHQHLFNLLMNNDLRHLLDMIAHRFATREYICFALSQDEANSHCISTFDSNEHPVTVLQEATSDMTGSLIVYSALSSRSATAAMNEASSTSQITLFPAGLGIVPVYGENGSEDGSMVTVGFNLSHPGQDMWSIDIHTVNTMNRLMDRIVRGINTLIAQHGQ
ncbi:homeobox-leucine zipper protein HDG1-like [Bidens hawaiensis]|uniref:homeobox-leucine zipper protein HDG1-like n=1 Tax=Bidens hawaiensis TaxID=980011 RepID=UPI00404B468A